MNGIAFAFFFTAALCVTGGMVWGLQMSASGNHVMAGAHAHLNLVGWATMALFGLYYHVVPLAAVRPLAKAHYLVALAGVVLMVPGIAMAISDQGELLAVLGSFLTFASMLIFLFTVAMTRAPA